MVVFRKITVTMLTLLFAYVSVAVGAPLALDGNAADTVVAGVTSVNRSIESGAAASTHQAAAFALVQDQTTSSIVENAASDGLLNLVPLSPALLLFGGALGAIFWLGRRRKAAISNWEQ
jgi:hypothetical protein